MLNFEDLLQYQKIIEIGIPGYTIPCASGQEIFSANEWIQQWNKGGCSTFGLVTFQAEYNCCMPIIIPSFLGNIMIINAVSITHLCFCWNIAKSCVFMFFYGFMKLFLHSMLTFHGLPFNYIFLCTMSSVYRVALSKFLGHSVGSIVREDLNQAFWTFCFSFSQLT